jgi:hypothetical protein
MGGHNPLSRSEKRCFVRYPHTLAIRCRLLGDSGNGGWPATLVDLSRKGAAVEIARECPRGTVLALSVDGLVGRFERPVLLRVSRVKAVSPTLWRIGCTFVKPLSEEELQAVLLARSAEE